MFLNHHAGWFFPTVLFQGFVFGRQALKSPQSFFKTNLRPKKRNRVAKNFIAQTKRCHWKILLAAGWSGCFLGGPTGRVLKGTSSQGWSEVKGGFTVTTPGYPLLAWRIIPVSNWLGSPPFITPFSPFGRGISLLRGLTITMVINHLLTGMILQVGV